MTYMIQFAAAMVATISFAVLFSVPKKELLLCGLSGGLESLFYYIVTGMSVNAVAACLVATLLLTVFSRMLAVIRRNPVTMYLIAGIFPLVPGSGIYYTAYYLINGDGALFSSYGLETLEIAFAITFGIIFGSAIPQKFFHKLAGKIRQDNYGTNSMP